MSVSSIATGRALREREELLLTLLHCIEQEESMSVLKTSSFLHRNVTFCLSGTYFCSVYALISHF